MLKNLKIQNANARNFKKKYEMSLIVFLVLLGSCTHKQGYVSYERTPAQAQDLPSNIPEYTLPDHAQWVHLYDEANSLNFTQSNTVIEIPKNGTSVYPKATVDGKTIGATIPKNSATQLSGEILTFHLARVLGVADLYQPGIYYNLRGDNLKKFMTLVNSSSFSNGNKEDNRIKILARYKENPNQMDAVFKSFKNKPIDYEQIDKGLGNEVLPGGTAPVARMLQCNGPQPSKTRMVTLKNGKDSEYNLIKQLSAIFLIDALTMQRDRFTGGNLQILIENKVARFASFDNGGTWGGEKSTRKYLSLVSRYDVEVGDRILQMADFLENGGSFLNIRNQQEFAQAMGIEKFPNDMELFKAALKLVADHIRKNSGTSCKFE